MATKLKFEPAPSRAEFKKALTKLATDEAFREQATKNPSIITRQFKLSVVELSSLREAAILSGADITAVDKLRATAIRDSVGTSASLALRINISCCSCCCCCCGETAVA